MVEVDLRPFLDAGRLLSHRLMSDIDSLEDAFLTLTDREKPDV